MILGLHRVVHTSTANSSMPYWRADRGSHGLGAEMRKYMSALYFCTRNLYKFAITKL
jgi:hypothetical protein